MDTFTVTLPSGVEWIPAFIEAIDQDRCIGCGRCFKVCARKVLHLRGVNESGEFVDEDDDEDEYEKKVMTIAQPHLCIGCQACATVCSRSCINHAPLAIVV